MFLAQKVYVHEDMIVRMLPSCTTVIGLTALVLPSD